MTFEDAQNFKMPFGKYKGKTLDEIATSDEGLRYIDWMHGEFEVGSVARAVDAYCSDPSIAKEIENL